MCGDQLILPTGRLFYFLLFFVLFFCSFILLGPSPVPNPNRVATPAVWSLPTDYSRYSVLTDYGGIFVLPHVEGFVQPRIIYDHSLSLRVSLPSVPSSFCARQAVQFQNPSGWSPHALREEEAKTTGERPNHRFLNQKPVGPRQTLPSPSEHSDKTVAALNRRLPIGLAVDQRRGLQSRRVSAPGIRSCAVCCFIRSVQHQRPGGYIGEQPTSLSESARGSGGALLLVHRPRPRVGLGEANPYRSWISVCC